MHNDVLDSLSDYPFDRLRALLGDSTPPDGCAPIYMQIGEPKHAPPELIAPIVTQDMSEWGRYPPPNGPVDLRAAIAGWLTSRYDLPAGMVDPARHIAIVSGTREALFMAALLAVPREKRGQQPAVLMPNPFYQVYVGAGALARGEAIYLSAGPETFFQPDFGTVGEDTLARTALAYLNTPANPQGSVASLDRLKQAVTLAREHDFVLAVDECYSEIYTGTKPPGLLDACRELGGDHPFANTLVFHSLSKRSNVPGLRSGFVAGDPNLIRLLLRLRQYGGAQVPLPLMHASAALWRDEAHVQESRELYRQKFDLALDMLDGAFGAERPGGGFYLWLDVGDSEAAARTLWTEAGLRVLPGAYMARDNADGSNPGAAYIRMALVHDLDTTKDAITRLLNTLANQAPA
ncbi:MAG: aspartate aminotransferase [Alphaproteobacteria bacterium]|nr:aspartate aminotransferase [Alphaproteobacteria bacterium]